MSRTPNADGSGAGTTCAPLVPLVMEKVSVLLYHPPTKIALLSDEVSASDGAPVVSQ